MFDPEVMQILGLNLMAGKSPNFAENLGNAGLATMQYRRQQEEDKYRKEEREFIKQQRQLQIEQLRRQQAAQQSMEGLYRQFVTPGAPPLPYNDTLGSEPPQGPIPGAPPSFNMEGYMAALPTVGPQGLAEAARLRKDMNDYMSVPEGGTVFNKATGQNVFSNPKKPADQYVQLSAEEIAALGLPPGIAYQRNLATGKIDAFGSRAPITTIHNNMGANEGFKDSMALSARFDAQPEVKAFKEVRQAWDQISTTLATPSGANDLAAATKFMKLLDPGSVVRESELAMAMQATGMLDRFKNYHNQLLKGQKLTPQQRVDFYNAGKALHDAAEGRYNQTVQQYQELARRYNLNPDFIAPSSKPKLARNTTALVEARAAIARGAPREAVIQTLVRAGIDPEEL